MIRKPSILIGVIVSTVLLIVSTKYFAEGSLYDSNSIEHGWKNNYLVNPFGIKSGNSSTNSPGINYFRSIIPFKQFWFMSY